MYECSIREEATRAFKGTACWYPWGAACDRIGDGHGSHRKMSKEDGVYLFHYIVEITNADEVES